MLSYTIKQQDKKMGFLETLTLVFIVLKITEVIAWSWWAVFSPLWVGYAVLLGAFLLAMLFRWLNEKVWNQ